MVGVSGGSEREQASGVSYLINGDPSLRQGRRRKEMPFETAPSLEAISGGGHGL